MIEPAPTNVKQNPTTTSDTPRYTPDTSGKMAVQMAAFSIDSHPQKAKIVDMIIAGRSVRDIADTVHPPVSFNAIQRYKASVIKPMLSRAEELSHILNGDQTTKSDPKALSSNPEAIQKTTQAILAAPALHIRENRIRLNQEISNRLLTVVNERGAEMELCEDCRRPADLHPWEDDTNPGRRCDTFRSVPGGKTGLIVRKLKATGVEYAVDTGLLAEIREHEKHVAIELGQWQEGVVGQVSIQIVCPTAPGGDQQPRITFEHQDALEAAIEEGDDGIAGIGVLQKNE